MHLLEGGDQAKKKPRTIGSRSRDGCKTCKIRRVKCDEGKPGCSRCKAFGRECDGYSVQVSDSSDTWTQKPATSFNSYATTAVGGNNRVIAPSPASKLKITQLSVMPNFDTSFEEQYFHFFHTDTADSLAGGVAENLFWKQIVPQACLDHRCIFHLATALAALDQTFKLRKFNSSDKIAEAHHQNALKQYEKGLASLRGLLSTSENSTRIALIASLLIHDFELFHGDTRQALMQIRSAVQIMRSWVTQNSKSESRKNLSPAADGIEEELVHRFAALEVQLSIWVAPIEPKEPRLPIPASIAQAKFYVPPHFESYSEARQSFQLLVNRNVQAIEPFPTSGDAKSEVQNSLPFADILCASERLDHHEEVRRWLTAFEPLLTNLRSAKNRKDFIAAASMKANVLVLVILRLEGRAQTDTQPFHVFLPEFSQIVALGWEVLSHPGFEKGFVSDTHMIANLFTVIARCPNTSLQHEALDVIRRMIPRREGLWDSEAVARIGECLLTQQANAAMVDSKDRERKVGRMMQDASMAGPSTQQANRAVRQGSSDSDGRRVYMMEFIETQTHGMHIS